MGRASFIYYAATFAVAVCGVAAPKEAFSYTGNDLVANCLKEGAGWADGLCYGYIAGAMDGLEMKAIIDKTQVGYCLRPSVNNAQIKQIVTKYLVGHPETRDFMATLLVYNALIEAFPCSKQ